MNLKTNDCYACGQPIIWCLSPLGEPLMINAERADLGNVMLIPDPLAPKDKAHERKPIAMFVSPRRLKRRKELEGQTDMEYDDGSRYTNHEETCPRKEEL